MKKQQKIDINERMRMLREAKKNKKKRGIDSAARARKAKETISTNSNILSLNINVSANRTSPTQSSITTTPQAPAISTRNTTTNIAKIKEYKNEINKLKNDIKNLKISNSKKDIMINKKNAEIAAKNSQIKQLKSINGIINEINHLLKEINDNNMSVSSKTKNIQGLEKLYKNLSKNNIFSTNIAPSITKIKTTEENEMSKTTKWRHCNEINAIIRWKCKNNNLLFETFISKMIHYYRRIVQKYEKDKFSYTLEETVKLQQELNLPRDKFRHLAKTMREKAGFPMFRSEKLGTFEKNKWLPQTGSIVTLSLHYTKNKSNKNSDQFRETSVWGGDIKLSIQALLNARISQNSFKIDDIFNEICQLQWGADKHNRGYLESVSSACCTNSHGKRNSICTMVTPSNVRDNRHNLTLMYNAFNQTDTLEQLFLFPIIGVVTAYAVTENKIVSRFSETFIFCFNVNAQKFWDKKKNARREPLHLMEVELKEDHECMFH